MAKSQDIRCTNNKRVRLSRHTEAHRAVWFTVCVQYASEDTGIPIGELARELFDKGLAKWLLDGYDVFHTQGFEYMSEKIINSLKEVNENT